MQLWQTLSRKTILAHSKFLTVESHTVALPDGRVIADWPWVITPDYVDIVAMTDAEKFLCFRQTKYGVQGTTLAVVGGYLDAGEAPLAAAQRELREETGYAASDWTALGAYRVDANRGAGIAHLYLARGARAVAAPSADDLEEQELLLLTRAEVERAVLRGEFKVLAWPAAIALALLHLASSSA